MKLSTETPSEYRQWLHNKVKFYSEQILFMEQLGKDNGTYTEEVAEAIEGLKKELANYQVKLKEAYALPS